MKNIHGNALLYRRFGLLITGPSGSGKTCLMRQLLDYAERRSWFARLVADDQVLLQVCHNRLLAHAPRTIAGRMEVFGLGIVSCAYEPVARIHGLIALTTQEVERLPPGDAQSCAMQGVTLPRLTTALRHDSADLVNRFVDERIDTPAKPWLAETQSCLVNGACL